MMVTIHQPQYLPWLGYFDKIDQADVFILLDNVQFKKNEWQNRNRIRTPQGWQWLTVPVLHDFGQPIHEVKINNSVNWRDKHLKSIEHNYGKAAYFSRYFGYLEETLRKKWDNIVDINTHFIIQLIDLLGIKTKIVKASEFKTCDGKTERLVDLCQHVGADIYLSGKGGQHYLKEEHFEEKDMQILIQKYQHPVYPQQWCKGSHQDFVSHLSVIDLLLNCGPDSLAILTQERKAA